MRCFQASSKTRETQFQLNRGLPMHGPHNHQMFGRIYVCVCVCVCVCVRVCFCRIFCSQNSMSCFFLKFADFAALNVNSPPAAATPTATPTKTPAKTLTPTAADLANNPFMADLLPPSPRRPSKRASTSSLSKQTAEHCTVSNTVSNTFVDSMPAWTDPWAAPALEDDDERELSSNDDDE